MKRSAARGLAIAAGFCGTIDAHSERAGRGSEFVVTLPVASDAVAGVS